LSGYLQLGAKLLREEKEFAGGWNFGPEENECLTVKEVLNIAKKSWGAINFEEKKELANLHEANLLSLNIDKAKTLLSWSPKWKNDLAIERTILWYKNFYENQQLNTINDLNLFINS